METIDLDRAKALVKAAVLRLPNNVNPVNDSGTCVYTHHQKTDWHCIVGQAVVDAGGIAPDHTYEGGIRFARDELGHEWNVDFTPDALEFLQAAQTIFDGSGAFKDMNDEVVMIDWNGSPRRWDDAYKLVEEHLL